MEEKILIFDFGSQYTQLIARRIREHNVYCDIVPFNYEGEIEANVKGIVLSGSPFSVRGANALEFDLNRIAGHCPILAICYGAQYVAQKLGGEVVASNKREYGKANLHLIATDELFTNLEDETQVWMSHSDSIKSLSDEFKVIGASNSIPVAAYKVELEGQPLYGLQFHPEVTHTIEGKEILSNFLFRIADCSGNWTPAHFIDSTVEDLRSQVGDEHVMMALSGGVDSTVAAMLLHQAIGDRLFCFFINNGLLRKREFEEVLEHYKQLDLNVKGIDKSTYFYSKLAGVTDPEEKRKIIGNGFIEVFEEEAKNHPEIQWLGQGTIYPDVIESISVHGPSVTIKSHHNVGGLPEKMNLKVIEPLRALFKDEVRRVGNALGLNASFVQRHPFPGPGLAIRILGEISPARVALLQEADDIYIKKLKEYDLYDHVWQAGAILLPIQSVGVMGDERTYESVVALRAVNSVDGMTAEWSDLPHEFLADVSSTIINEVKGINRIVYDISTKPPATIEWE